MLTKEQRAEWVRRGYQDPTRAYARHAAGAARRGIEFKLTFPEWWGLWEDRYEQRGTRKGQYVMCRTADKGAYEMGNVRIATGAENAHEYSLEYRTKYGLREQSHQHSTPSCKTDGNWLWRRNVFLQYTEEDEDETY